ncbi:helix-turn-helix domain-containing protein [Paenibacillus sp. F411]|uniref:helix-turn-helix domain-containing protein n=1 Tax=Paenibacillus sp. F411 TaxID=2820239 RepID=UPI001AAE8386|nr:helix-turn-helix domain-containing protein [Paenibacillus sp. F411]MBO2945603.1 helix-turn-helix domain-containing protein [Paenibacillus sp. F411]
MKLNGYLQRLIAFTLLLSMLPVAILGIFSYFKSSSDIQDKVNDGNMLRLKQTQMTVEQVLKTVEHTAVRFANSPLVNDHIDVSLTPHEFGIVGDLMNELTTLSGGQLQYMDPVLISVREGWAVSDDGLSPMADKIGYDELNYYLERPGQSFWISEAGDPFTGSQAGDINLVIKIPLNDRNPSGLLLVRTSSGDVNRHIFKSQRSGSIMVLDHQDRVLLSETELAIGDNAARHGFFQDIQNTGLTSGYTESDVGEERSAISFIESSYNGWTYLSIVSIDDITSESRMIGWLTLVICVVTLLFTSLISFFGSFRMYQPIRSLYDLSAQMTGTTEPLARGGDEFRIISERIQRLDMNRSRLTEQLDRQVEQLNEFFMLKLLHGEIPRKDIGERLHMFGYDESTMHQCVLAIQIDTLEGTLYEEKDKDLMLFAMKNIVTELAPSQGLHACMVTGHSVIVVRGSNQSSKEQFLQELYAEAETFQKEIKHYLKLKASIGISRVYSDFEQLPLAYSESVEALKYRMKLGYESILFIEDMTSGGGNLAYPEQLENRLLDAVKETNADQAVTLLEEWVNELFRTELRIDEYRLSLVRLLTQIMRIVQDSGESLRWQDQENKSVIDQLFELNSRQDILEWFRDTVIAPAVTLLDERRGEKYKSISDEVIRIIHEEYDTDLTLEECAARLHYHPSYIWRILRKESGISFSEYLAQHRLKMAKQWLEETEMTITEIAERLRYNNAQNFIRYFKKMEGVSPGKYRKQHHDPDAS